jgi:glutamine synthetase
MPRMPDDLRKLATNAGVKIVDSRCVDLHGMRKRFSISRADLGDDPRGTSSPRGSATAANTNWPP